MFLLCIHTAAHSSMKLMTMQSRPSKKARTDLFADLRSWIITLISCESSSEEPLSDQEELARYKALRVLSKHRMPLVFWQENAKEFPSTVPSCQKSAVHLCKLCAVRGRLFVCGRTIIDARARLYPRKVEDIVTPRSWIHEVNDYVQNNFIKAEPVKPIYKHC